MSNRQDSRSGAEQSDGPRIPDGGLPGVMPDWLRATPEWKRQPDRATARLLPPPDTSRIDPRDMLTAEDLPAWLRELPAVTEVRRGTDAPDPPSPPLAEPEPEPVVQGPALRPEPAFRNSVPAYAAEPAPRTYQEPPRRPWWTADWVLGVLMIAIVITIVYVVLVANGTI